MSSQPVASPEPLRLDADDLAPRVRDLIRRLAPSFWREREIDDDLRLDDAGIGFDSVALVELLVACEQELGVPLPTDALLDDGMTVGALVAKLRRVADPSA